jgi:probable HAF family extracellular repeat protein
MRIQVTGVLVAIASAVVAFADPFYTMSPISLSGTTFSTPRGVNESGNVVGSAGEPGTGGTIAWITGAAGENAYTVAPLGSAVGTPSNCFYAINNEGTAVGYSYVNDGGVTRYHAVRYDGTTQTDIGTLGGANSYAYGINTAGTIVGTSNATSTTQHAFAYSDGAMTDLGFLGSGTFSQASAINSAGVIVGYSTTNFEASAHAFKYEDGMMTDLGVPENLTASYATCIADNGCIGGYGYTAAGITVPLLDTGAGLEDIGYLYSSGGTRNSASINGVNSAGIAVGYTYTPTSQQVGLLCIDGTFYDLNDFLPAEYTGWRITNALDISESGWIAATAVPSGSYTASAFLLHLTVPEPSSLVLLIPLIALCRRARP